MINNKIYIISLGCAKNLVDTENMMGLLVEHGYELTNDANEAGILMVNTCGFIEAAKDESIRTILQLAEHKESRECRLVVTGCLAQRYSSELAKEIPEIDGIIGTGKIKEITAAIDNVIKGKRVNYVGGPGYKMDRLLPRVVSGPGKSVYVKIAEGCSNLCSYCAIPYIRGPYRSKPMEIIEQEVEHLVGNGAKEVILVAQDTTRYGYDLYGEYMLAKLIKRLCRIPGLDWLRIMYCYPDHFTGELIETIAQEPKVCKYIDMPLQHASKKILKNMNRRGEISEVKKLIGKLREAVPGITLRTTFIVGFPGETEEDFNELLEFMREMRFDKVGIFKYSAEEGTAAGEMKEQVNEMMKEERYHRAMELQQRISWEINQQKIGETIKVLTEGELPDKPGTYFGRSKGDAPEVDGLVYFRGGRKVNFGEIVNVKITSAYEYDLMGVMV